MTSLYVPDSPKMLRETLCAAQAALAHQARLGGGFAHQHPQHSERLGRLIAECDRHRPLGPDGKHGDLHTATCGCAHPFPDLPTTPTLGGWVGGCRSAGKRRLRVDQLPALPAVVLGGAAVAMVRAARRLLMVVDDAETVPMEGDDDA